MLPCGKLAYPSISATGCDPRRAACNDLGLDVVLSQSAGSRSASKDGAREAETLLEQPLHDTRASVHTRDGAENLQAKLRGLSQNRK